MNASLIKHNLKNNSMALATTETVSAASAPAPSSTTFRNKVQSANSTAICTSSNTQNVGRRTVRELLLPSSSSSYRYEVPIFQRRYCWTEVQWETLWNDVVFGVGGGGSGGRHSLGRLTCTDVHPPPPPPPSSSSFLLSQEQPLPRSCILDGQQRFTTLTIFLASIRDVLQKYVSSSSFSNNGTDNITMMMKAQKLLSTINQMLFVDVQAMESWMSEKQLETTTDKVEEGIELQFCRLIPTFCDRLAYAAAILPPSIPSLSSSSSRTESAQIDKAGENPITQLRSSYSPDWHRPLAAKSYLTEKIEDLIRINQHQHINQKDRSILKVPLLTSSSTASSSTEHIDIVIHTLEKLSNQLLDGVDMLVFPIDVGTGRTDGTQDLMVIYERLALRDATFCKPHRQTEYQSMDAVDLIRNLLLGTFSDPQSAVDFYRDQWLPLERYVGQRTIMQKTKKVKATNTDSNINRNHKCEEQDEKEDTKLESSSSGMKLLLEEFLEEQRKDLHDENSSSNPEEEIMPLPPPSTALIPPSASGLGIPRPPTRKTMTKRRRNTNNNKNNNNNAKTIIGGQLYRDFEDWLTEDLGQRNGGLSPSDHTRQVGKILQQFAIDRYE